MFKCFSKRRCAKCAPAKLTKSAVLKRVTFEETGTSPTKENKGNWIENSQTRAAASTSKTSIYGNLYAAAITRPRPISKVNVAPLKSEVSPEGTRKLCLFSVEPNKARLENLRTLEHHCYFRILLLMAKAWID